MTPKLAGLKLTLQALGIPLNTESLSGRIQLQKSVYLAQAAGVPLRYRYNWYLRGPYSPDLTRDYFELPQTETADGYRLSDRSQEAIELIKPLLTVPPMVGLPRDRWLELLASLLYLEREAGKSRTQAYSLIAERKPSLRSYAPFAQKQLEAVG